MKRDAYTIRRERIARDGDRVTYRCSRAGVRVAQGALTTGWNCGSSASISGFRERAGWRRNRNVLQRQVPCVGDGSAERLVSGGELQRTGVHQQLIYSSVEVSDEDVARSIHRDSGWVDESSKGQLRSFVAVRVIGRHHKHTRAAIGDEQIAVGIEGHPSRRVKGAWAHSTVAGREGDGCSP